MVADKNNKSALLEATSTNHKRHQLKHSAVPEIEVSTSKKSKIGKESTKDTNVLSESKGKLPFADTTWKKKRKSMGSKVNTFLYALLNRFCIESVLVLLNFFLQNSFLLKKAFSLAMTGIKKKLLHDF